MTSKLFPLNGGAGLGGEVIEYAVDAGDLGGDASGDVLQQREGDVLDGGGHRVDGIDRAQDDGVGVGAGAVLHADRTEIGYDGEILPDLIRQPVLRKFLAQDGVRLAHGLQPVAGDGA